MQKRNFIKYLIRSVPKWIQYSEFYKNELVLFVHPQFIFAFSTFLRDHVNTQYKQLIDITAIDTPSKEKRFSIVYNFLSIEHNSRIRLKMEIDELTHISSITQIFSCASWGEREVWDMFGIFFSNHPDCRRILTDYGFRGHPLRKDFPLSGYVEVRYDDSEKRVITQPIENSQEFRFFDFESPWEQLTRRSV